MTLREITVGRSKNSDIYLDDRCIYASSNHGSLYYDGNQLMYRDNSSNGTMVNNIMVKHRAVPVRHGDIIMIAGRYQLNWNQIDMFFPPTYNHPMNVEPPRESPVQQALRAAAEEPDLNKWNWGAFCLSGLWGFFNGCPWMILINIFFWWLGPIPMIFFGMYGTRWAWQNKSWTSVQDFEETQDNWATWSLIIFCVSIVLSAMSTFFIFAAHM